MSIGATAALLLLTFGSLKAAPQSMQGVWQSQGWGSVYEIHGPVLRSYEITTSTCVPAFSARWRASESSADQATFRSSKEGTLYVVVGEGPDHMRVQRHGALTSITLRRITELPKVCSPPTANTLLGNFDVFAETFSENYIGFDLRYMNWDQTMTQQRGKVTAQTTQAELFDILSAMINP
jgi:hypothetical protein